MIEEVKYLLISLCFLITGTGLHIVIKKYNLKERNVIGDTFWIRSIATWFMLMGAIATVASAFTLYFYLKLNW